ncbi:MAG: helix-turn-helix transcriptional regulator [Eubacteriales bacterium]
MKSIAPEQFPIKIAGVVVASNVRRSNIPYIIMWIIYYAWVISFSTWWTASPSADKVFDESTRSMMHIAVLISASFFVFVIRKQWFVRTARIGALMLAAAMLAFLIAGHTVLSTILVLIISVFIGMVNISCLIPFVFVLNNTEKMYAVVGSNILIGIIGLIVESKQAGLSRTLPDMAATYIFLLAGLAFIFFFKLSDITKQDATAPRFTGVMSKNVYLSLLFSCLFLILCRGAGKGLLNTAAKYSSLPLVSLNFIGGLIGCTVFFLVFAFVKWSVNVSWNISFATLAMGLLFNAFSIYNHGLLAAFAVLQGMSGAVGMISMYYILGVIGKKYNSIHYVRLSILLISFCGGIAGIAAGNFINSADNFRVSVFTSLVSAGIMLLLLIISPIFSHSYYDGEWVKDSEKAEISGDTESGLKSYKLTKRELEVCELLLKGHTMRQISGMLSLAYPTINTYCTSAYRKLGINSRTELLLRFGERNDKG